MRRIIMNKSVYSVGQKVIPLLHYIVQQVSVFLAHPVYTAAINYVSLFQKLFEVFTDKPQFAVLHNTWRI